MCFRYFNNFVTKQCLMHLEEYNHCFMHFLASKHCLGHLWAPPSIKKGPGARSCSVTDRTVTQCTAQNLECGTTYQFRVREECYNQLRPSEPSRANSEWSTLSLKKKTSEDGANCADRAEPPNRVTSSNPKVTESVIALAVAFS